MNTPCANNTQHETLVRLFGELTVNTDTKAIHVHDGSTPGGFPTDYTINVKRFGAKGDGTTDDCAAIQAALDYAGARGGRVHIPTGTYLISGTLTTPTYTSPIPGGLVISGEGIGSKLVFNTTNEGIKIYSPGTIDQGYSVRIVALTFKHGASTPSCFIKNKGPLNTNIERCYFVDAAATYGIDNDTGYGLNINNCVWAGFVGTPIVYRQNGAFTNWSNINSITGCDISNTTGNGIEIEGCVGLLIQDTVIENSSGKGIYAHPQDTTTFAMAVSIKNCWFENNTGTDVDLQSTVDYWCEAVIENTIFIGSPTVALGAKSRITVSGFTSNATTISGSAAACAILINATNYVQSGSFPWTYQNSNGEVVAYANVFAGVTSESGSVTNTRAMIGGRIYSAKGVAESVPVSTPTTLFTLPSTTVGTWILTASLAAASAPAWTAVALITVQGTSVDITMLKTASGSLTITNSGLNIQGTHTGGSAFSIEWSLVCITQR